MVKKKLKHLCNLYLILCLFGCAPTADDQATVFVAAGLSPVVNAVKDHPEFKSLLTNAASSGTLARQIESGAQPDIYFSANYKWIEYLVGKDLLDSSKVKIVAKNKLVAIMPVEKISAVFSIDSALSNAKTIAIGNSKYVPVGEYTNGFLKKLGCFESAQHKFIEAKDVMSVLKLIEMEEADLGFVYKSVALASEKVRIIYEATDSLCSPINFYSVPLTAKGTGVLENNNFKTLFNKQLVEAGFEIQ